MNAIRGLSSLAPSFIPKFLSDYPRIHLFSKTNTSRFDICNSISVELTTTFKEGTQQVVLGNRDFPYLKDGIRMLEEKVNKIWNGNGERDEGFTAILRCGIREFFLKRTD